MKQFNKKNSPMKKRTSSLTRNPTIFKFIIFLLAFAWITISAYLFFDAQRPLPRTPVHVESHFCLVDNCTQVLLSYLMNSTDIACAFFELSHPDILDFFEVHQAHILVDSQNAKNYTFPVILHNKSSYMHNKFCILDQSRVLTGSTNPTMSGLELSENNIIVIESATLAQSYLAEWNELETQAINKATHEETQHKTDSYISIAFCPEDDCEQTIASLLLQANESIDAMLFSFTSKTIGEILDKKSKDNAFKDNSSKMKMRIITDGKQNPQGNQIAILNKSIETKEITHKGFASGFMHHKVFIIDNKITITGSFNPSKNANTRNDENIVIIFNETVAADYSQEFERLWALE